jgi:hypothetical protein
MNKYDYGDALQLTGTWTIDDVATDPTVITFKVKKPNGDVITYIYNTDEEVVKVSTGVYYIILNLNQEGVWHYRWEGTGSAQAASESQFEVKDSAFY